MSNGSNRNSPTLANQSWIIKGLKDSTDFNTFVRDNMQNEEFKKYGREHGMALVKDQWYWTRLTEEKKNLREMSKAEAIQAIRDAVPQNVLDGWFRNADSNYKPALMDAVVSHNGTFNAGLNIAYQNYKDSVTDGRPMTYAKWLRTPITLYRGTRGQASTKGDVFMSYTPDRSVAESFGGNVDTIRVRPIDTWGSYQTTGEQEYLIPYKRRR